MKVALGVTWIPRKNETLERSLKSIGYDATVYPDGYELPLKVPQKTLGDNVGCFKHYYRVLQDLCTTDADIVGIMPDDLVYQENWLQIAVPKLTEGVGFVSCFVPRGVAYLNGWRHKGWYSLNKGWMSSWGGAYLYRKETAKKILEHPYLIDHRDNYKKNQQIDHAIPETVYRMGLKQLFRVPSLTNHIGYTSTIGHTVRVQDIGAGW